LSALVLLVPELEPLLADIRSQHDPAAALGMPPHVTLLYPFASPRRLTDEQRTRLRAIAAARPAPELCFAQVQRFPQVLWLAPEPVEPLLALTGAFVEAFPAYPPYRGKFATVIPHLTVAQAPEAVLGSLEGEVARRLATPVRSRPDAVALFTTVGGLWKEVERFPLG
jgi:2'-5' RNA ligase